MNSPTLTLPPRADLSLNWVIRLASPKPVRQPSTQASWACSGRWLCRNTAERSGSTPAARYCAAVTRVRAVSSDGSCSTVMACRSATKKNAS